MRNAKNTDMFQHDHFLNPFKLRNNIIISELKITSSPLMEVDYSKNVETTSSYEDKLLCRAERSIFIVNTAWSSLGREV